MRSRPAKLALCIVAWVAFGAAAFFVFQSEQHVSNRRAALRAFDAHAHEAADALADVRAAQQAYVAQGQSTAFWMPAVKSLRETVATTIQSLRGSATGADARRALGEAAASADEFGTADDRARDFLVAGQTLMAADVVFAEANGAALTASRRLEAGRVAERQAVDALEATTRRDEAFALGVAAAIGALFLLVLSLSPVAAGEAEEPLSLTTSSTLDLSLSPAPEAAPLPETLPKAEEVREPEPRPRNPRHLESLKAAADLCTEFGRASQLVDLQKLLGRASDMIHARGLAVWLGSPEGADLRPILAHGYPPQALSRMPPVPRAADNAVAAAYRTGTLQVVAGSAGQPGAIVAPLIAPDGCVGALTAEITGGGESSSDAQALSMIFAAQLAGVLSSSTSGGDQSLVAIR
jgi:hypothetical protein